MGRPCAIAGTSLIDGRSVSAEAPDETHARHQRHQLCCNERMRVAAGAKPRRAANEYENMVTLSRGVRVVEGGGAVSDQSFWQNTNTEKRLPQLE